MHWGTGSAVTSVLLARPRYGDLYVDADEGWGVGIDACSVDAVTGNARDLALAVRLAGTEDRRLILVVKSSRPRTVWVNGRHQGACTSGTSPYLSAYSLIIAAKICSTAIEQNLLASLLTGARNRMRNTNRSLAAMPG